MLEYLHVKNLALLEECELSFGPGLNILTGETGAGKSVLLGSVNLALGARADKDMIRSGAEEAYVELGFSVNDDIINRLRAMDISCDEDTVYISRKLSATKNVFKINGEISTARQVKELAASLIDIHGQHEHQSLLSNERQREMLDAFGGDCVTEKLAEVATLCREYEKLRKELDSLNEMAEGRERKISLLKYECDEISNANLVLGEDAELEERFHRMVSGEKLVDSTKEALEIISSERGNCVSSDISRAIQTIKKASSLDDSLNSIFEKLCEAEELIGDVSVELSSYIDSLEFEPDEFVKVEERLNEINSLKSRFGNTIDKILAYYDDKLVELDKLTNMDEYLTKISEKTDAAMAAYLKSACELSSIRKETAKRFSNDLTNELMSLNFNAISFESLVAPDESVVSPKGYDSIEFMISTNQGEPRKPMKNVASGGELSRIMLGIKTILAKEDNIDALIFDEIDAGISGKTAWEVSRKLNKLSNEHQILAITHLAQIAAMADSHYEIVKDTKDNRTYTFINLLDKEGEISELARLLGADASDVAALSNAQELKDRARMEKTGE